MFFIHDFRQEEIESFVAVPVMKEDWARWKLVYFAICCHSLLKKIGTGDSENVMEELS